MKVKINKTVEYKPKISMSLAERISLLGVLRSFLDPSVQSDVYDTASQKAKEIIAQIDSVSLTADFNVVTWTAPKFKRTQKRVTAKRKKAKN